MTRKIIGTIITVLVAVRMLMTSNQTWLDVISDWTFTFCGLVSLFLLMSDAGQLCHPARRIYDRSIRKRKAEALGAIDNLRRSPFFTPTDYDPHNRVITAAVGFKRTWRRRAVDAVLWLANRRVFRTGSRSWWSSNSAGSTEINRRDANKTLIQLSGAAGRWSPPAATPRLPDQATTYRQHHPDYRQSRSPPA